MDDAGEGGVPHDVLGDGNDSDGSSMEAIVSE